MKKIAFLKSKSGNEYFDTESFRCSNTKENTCCPKCPVASKGERWHLLSKNNERQGSSTEFL